MCSPAHTYCSTTQSIVCPTPHSPTNRPAQTCAAGTTKPVSCATQFTDSHLTTKSLGAGRELSDCLCQEGYFDYHKSDDGVDGRDCVICPPAAECESVGVTTPTLPIKRSRPPAGHTRARVPKLRTHTLSRAGRSSALRAPRRCLPHPPHPTVTTLSANAAHPGVSSITPPSIASPCT